MKDEKIQWCKKQKSGIKVVLPSENLCHAYVKKAQNSLRSMDLTYDADILEWAVDAAYYARYQAVYALLQKVGVKCEIHDCTIALFRFLFADIFDNSFFEEIEMAKEQRINLTYYTDRLVPRKEIEENINKASAFVMEIEKYIESASSKEIQQLEKKVKDSIGKRQ